MQKIIGLLFGRLLKAATGKKTIESVLGLKPGNISLYEKALTHRSVQDATAKNNERLEYLGDAILGAIVADYLFKKYPTKGEGFLTEMRSKMVNRSQLNDIAVKMGLKRITIFNRFDSSLRNSQIFGNTLEAIVGAIYLDKGYDKTQKWIYTYLISPYVSIDQLEQTDINLKNKLISWAGRNHKQLEFKILDEILDRGRRIFTVGVFVDEEQVATGQGYNKKDASEVAAAKAMELLSLV